MQDTTVPPQPQEGRTGPGFAFGRLILEIPELGVALRRQASTGELEIIATRDFRAGDTIMAEHSIANVALASVDNNKLRAVAGLAHRVLSESPLAIALLAPRDAKIDRDWTYPVTDWLMRLVG
jgi:hypothetical protein